MREIKVRQRDRTPRVRNSSARLPKELMKTSLIKSKEKSREISRISESDNTGSSPTEYAGNKIEAAEERIVMETGPVGKRMYTAGKKAAQKTYEKIRERKQADSKESSDQEWWMDLEDTARKEVSEKKDADKRKEAADEAKEKGRELSKSQKQKTMADSRPSSDVQRIKTRPEPNGYVKGEKRPSIKEAPNTVRTSAQNLDKIRTSRSLSGRGTQHTSGQAAALVKRQAVQARAERQMADRYVQRTIQAAGKTTGVARKLIEAIEKALTTAKAVGMMAGLIGGMAMMILIIIVGILGGVLFSSTSQSTLPLSDEVLSYTSLIELYAEQYGIGEYVQVIQAIMMQESAGRGTDPMQCSECPYNTQYPNTPGAITDPEYSIQVGIRYYADCVRDAGCTGPQDMDRLKLSLQGYNYGNGYISWAVRNYGGYSEANALQFSQEQAVSHGWERYGDPEYVPHVLQYYSSGNIFVGLFGNGQMVSVALSQLGNSGGQKFWSWYGFPSRVSWCACFASWCGDQCGLIESGAMPKFSLCDDAISWFKAKNKWQGRNYSPSPGTLIFFDWMQGGIRDGSSDHVGIVEKCENGVVYTIEGNSSDAVRQRSYTVGEVSIMGYGLISN